MAWRVIADGAMLEVLLGKSPDGNEKTRTAIFREGTVIKEDLSSSMVERYDGNDETIRAQVERVEVTQDDDGNDVVTPVGAPSSSESSSPVSDADAIQRAEAAEKEAAELRSQVAGVQQELDSAQSAQTDSASQVESLQGEVQRLEGELATAEEAATSSLSYSDLSVQALRVEADERDLQVTRADGKEGDPLKTDLVNALEGARSGS